ncbi:GTPase Era, mitochondrial-like [Anneissia japonica]|uniref:GTPase Era, mitochondrial-like n=1 Tax=Anneissia japonica TaxID=1529436 RepID=UPI0014258F85|nr:GTPase Era, mitochondrial-like [Anneissia japonica]
MAAAIARNVLHRKNNLIPFVRVTALSNNICEQVSAKISNFKVTSSSKSAWIPSKCTLTLTVRSRTFSTHSLGNDKIQQEEQHAFKELGEGSSDGEFCSDEELCSPQTFEPVSPDKGTQELLLIKPPEQPENPRCVRVAIIGTPNAGKSTLVNTLLGRRICAVSKKVHTTRRQATAVFSENDTQVIILDTPGMVTKDSARRHSLPRELVISPKSSLELADLIVVIVDVADKWTCRKISTDILMELNNFQETPCILVLNKVDILKNKQSLVELTALLTEGVVDHKPIEMSGTLTKKLLKNKGFRSKYLQYKNVSACRREKNKVAGEDDILMSMTEKEPEMAASPCEPDRLLKSHPESQINSKDFTEEVSGTREDIHMHSDNYLLDTPDVPEENHRFQFPQRTSSQKLDILNKYIKNLDSVSKFYSLKESNNTEEKDKQVEANRRHRELLKEFSQRHGWHLFKKVFMVSAKSGDGVQELKDFLMESAKPEEWEYHKIVVTDLSPMEILEEAVREQLLECLPQEIPYNITQQNEFWDYDENGTLVINQRLVCFKKSHYNAVLRKIRTIAKQSEQDIMNAFHCDVLLIIKVKLSK